MSRLSYTACNIASCLIALYNDTRWSSMVTGEDAVFYKNCLTHAQKYSLVVRIFRPFPALVVALIERCFAKGTAKHFALRKVAIRNMVEEAYANGARQCVVLGGGLDIGAYRAALRHTDFNVYEIDRPFMHSLKMQVLQDTYGVLPANFVGVSADLATSRLADVLSSAKSFDAQRKTVFISEGVIMYLSEANVVDLLQQIRNISPVGSQFIFTAMAREKKESQGVRLLIEDTLLALYGEHSGFEIGSDKISDFLKDNHFQMLALLEKGDLQNVLPIKGLLQEQNREYIVSAVTCS